MTTEADRRAVCRQLVRDVLNNTDVEHLVTKMNVDQLGEELTNGLAAYWADRDETHTPDRDDANCAWSDFRKEYGVSADEYERRLEHRAFHAGWDAAIALKETK